ncbi:MAG: AAA family ATPase [Bacteroidota bacterium]
MHYIKEINFNLERSVPFPFDVPAIKFAKHIQCDSPITFFIGDNGTGKSTLLETIAYKLQLPHMDSSSYEKPSFNAAKKLIPYIEFKWNMQRPIGFFFRAEDFGDYMNSIHRRDFELHRQLKSLEGEVPDHIIKEMKENANFQIHHMRNEFGQELTSFSHGEAYLRIMQEKFDRRGIYILDEPEAALSPTKQLSLIYFIQSHLKLHQSQFIIATHSPMLMAIPGAQIYEITDHEMQLKSLEETEHYTITKTFLNNPDMYLDALGR